MHSPPTPSPTRRIFGSQLAVGPLERARVLKATAMASRVLCSCLPGGGQVENERRMKLQSAMANREYDLAEVLAMTAEEHQAVADGRKANPLHKRAQVPAGAGTGAGTGAGSAQGASLLLMDAKEKVQVEKAAVRVQAIARGHQKRDALQEERRLEWFAYYCREGEHAKALELAVTQQEIDDVHRLREDASLSSELRDASCLAPGAAAANTASGEGAEQLAERPFATAIREYNWNAAEALAASEEERADLRDSKSRVEWMGHYAKQGQYDRAIEMAITHEEQKQIEAMRTGQN